MINSIKLVFLCFYLLIWPIFRVFSKLGQKCKNIFFPFLVQMKTLKFSFEINWPLGSLRIFQGSCLLRGNLYDSGILFAPHAPITCIFQLTDWFFKLFWMTLLCVVLLETEQIDRDIHIECSKQFKWNLYFYVSWQSRPFWAALKLL